MGGAGVVGHGAALAHGDEAFVDGLAVGVHAHALGGGGVGAVDVDVAVIGQFEGHAVLAAHAFGVAALVGVLDPDAAVVFAFSVVLIDIDEGGGVGAVVHAPGNAGLPVFELGGGFRGRADVRHAADDEVGIFGNVIEEFAFKGRGRACRAGDEQKGRGERAEHVEEAALLQYGLIAIDKISDGPFGHHGVYLRLFPPFLGMPRSRGPWSWRGRTEYSKRMAPENSVFFGAALCEKKRIAQSYF